MLSRLAESLILASNKQPLLKLIAANLNQENLKTFLKFEIFGLAIACGLALLLHSPIPIALFMFVVFASILTFGLLGATSDRWRYSVLNNQNAYENTIYIWYFLIFKGFTGSLICGWFCIA